MFIEYFLIIKLDFDGYQFLFFLKEGFIEYQYNQVFTKIEYIVISSSSRQKRRGITRDWNFRRVQDQLDATANLLMKHKWMKNFEERLPINNIKGFG